MKNKQKKFIHLGSLTIFPLVIMAVSCRALENPQNIEESYKRKCLVNKQPLLSQLLLSFITNKVSGSTVTSSKIKKIITKYDGADFENQAKLFFKESIMEMFKQKSDIAEILNIKAPRATILSWLALDKITVNKSKEIFQPKDFGFSDPKKPYEFYMAKVPIKETNGQFLMFKLIKYYSAATLKNQIGETLNNLGQGIVDPDSIKAKSITNETIIFNQKQLESLKTLAKEYLDYIKQKGHLSDATALAKMGKYKDKLKELANKITEQIISKQEEIIEINNQLRIEYGQNIDNISKLVLNPKTNVIQNIVLSCLKKIPLKGFANYGELDDSLKKTWHKNDAYVLNISQELTNDADIFTWKYIDFEGGSIDGVLKWKKQLKKEIKFILVQSDEQQSDDIKNSFINLKPLKGYVNDTLNAGEILSEVFDRLKNIQNKIQLKYQSQNKKITMLFGSKGSDNAINSLNINSSTVKEEWIKKFLEKNESLSQATPTDSIIWNSYDIKQNKVYKNLKIFIKKTTWDKSQQIKTLKIPINSINSVAKFEIDPTLKELLKNISVINNIFKKPIKYKKPNWKLGEQYTSNMIQKIRDLVVEKVKTLLTGTPFKRGVFKIISNTLQVKVKQHINHEKILIEISFTYNAKRKVLFKGYVYAYV